MPDLEISELFEQFDAYRSESRGPSQDADLQPPNQTGSRLSKTEPFWNSPAQERSNTNHQYEPHLSTRRSDIQHASDSTAGDLLDSSATPIPRWLSKTPAQPALIPEKWINNELQQQARYPTDAQHRDFLLSRSTEIVEHLERDPEPLPQQSANRTTSSLSEIRKAALKRQAKQPVESHALQHRAGPKRPGYNIETLRRSAAEQIADGQIKLDIRAYLTAEERAKQALELIAQSIDTRENSLVATRDLTLALTAIREAEDFVGKYGLANEEAIARMVRSHSTEILKSYDTSNLSGMAAADIYLEWASSCIAPIAIADPLAVEAISIIAKSRRLRDNATPFGLATSIHLIRAAAHGAPGNASVKEEYENAHRMAGFTEQPNMRQSPQLLPGANETALVAHLDRSTDTMSSSNSDLSNPWGGKSQANVQIVELSPEQFAAISPIAAGPIGTPNQTTLANPLPIAPPEENSFKSRLSRIFNRLSWKTR